MLPWSCMCCRCMRRGCTGPASLLSLPGCMLRARCADFLPVCQCLPALQNVVQADALCTLSAIEEANTRVEVLLSEESRERHSVSGGAGQCRGGRGREAGRTRLAWLPRTRTLGARGAGCPAASSTITGHSSSDPCSPEEAAGGAAVGGGGSARAAAHHAGAPAGQAPG